MKMRRRERTTCAGVVAIAGVLLAAAAARADERVPFTVVALPDTQRYKGRPWYLGSAPGGRSHAQIFEGGGYRFLHLNFEFAPAPPIFTWARTVVAGHADSPVLVSTHG